MWDKLPSTPCRRVVWAVVIAATLFTLWFVPWVFLLDSGSVTVTRWDRHRGRVEATVGPSERGWTPIHIVSRHVLHAIIVAEDARFYDHHGIDVASMWDSFFYNMRRKRYARGGSTITQQVVKMAFLTREKSLIRKAREAVGAILLDMYMDKERILEWYINLAEFGDNVYGLEAAARHYWGTKPQLLRIDQGVHLAVVLPSPNAWSRGLRARALTPFGHHRFATIVTNMRRQGFITDDLWIATLTRGDFGRPINGYQKILAGVLSDDPPCATESDCTELQAPDEDTEETDSPSPTPTSSPLATEPQPASATTSAPAVTTPEASPEVTP